MTKIEDFIEQGEKLHNSNVFAPDFNAWRNTVIGFLKRTYKEKSHEVRSFEGISYYSEYLEDDDPQNKVNFQNGLRKAILYLKGYLSSETSTTEELIEQGETLHNSNVFAPDFNAWRNTVICFLKRKYGENSHEVRSFEGISYYSEYLEDNDPQNKINFQNGLRKAILYLKGYLSNETNTTKENKQENVTDTIPNNKIFIEAAERLRNGLLAKATDGDYSDTLYHEELKILSTDNTISKILPSFFRTCRTTSDFRRMIQQKFKTYAERREYISQEFQRIFDYLEKNNNDTDILSNNMDVYQMGEPLGEGGFGTVFKYKHKLLDYDFAIKIFHPMPFGVDEENAEKRFFREAKMLFELDHENIIHVYDIGRIEGRPFIRMEFINGYTLQDYISDKGIVSFERSKKPIIAILKGLNYAHKKNIIHRDLKPTNVMVTKDKIKIIDFGISAYLEHENHTKLTKIGEHIASGLYTDPMLFVNPKLKDVRSDIYSVGAIWFYLLTGRAPTSDARDLLFKTNKEVTELQGSIIFKCLTSDINERYQSCEEILNLLQPSTAGSIQTNSISSNRLTEITREAIFEFLMNLYYNESHHYIDDQLLPYQEPEKGFYYSGKKVIYFFSKDYIN